MSLEVAHISLHEHVAPIMRARCNGFYALSGSSDSTSACEASFSTYASHRRTGVPTFLVLLSENPLFQAGLTLVVALSLYHIRFRAILPSLGTAVSLPPVPGSVM